MFVLISYGLWLVHGRTGDALTSGTPIELIVSGVIDFGALIALYSIRSRIGPLLRASRWLLILLALTVLSSLWSEFHDVTFRRAFELISTAALAAYFASRFGLKGFLPVFALASVLATAFSIFLIVFAPNYGTQTEYDGAWAGMFSHKNHLGPAMTLGILTLTCLPTMRIRAGRFFQLLAILTMIVLLLGSKNAGGTGVAIFIAVLFPVLLWTRTARSPKPVLFGCLLLSVITVSALASGFGIDEVLALFGKESTLTGRTEVWDLVIAAIAQKPILGYGYQGFWGPESPAASLVYAGVNWMPASAHNGFLEVAIDLGVIGEIVLIAFLAVGFRAAWYKLWVGRDLLSCWPFFVMLDVCLENISDASFLTYNTTDSLVLIVAFLFAVLPSTMSEGESLRLSVRERQLRAATGIAAY